MRGLLFWMPHSFDPSVQDEDWAQYAEALSGEFILIFVLSVLTICGLYVYFTRRMTFEDISRPFWPMRLLWIALVPAVWIGVRAWLLFDTFDFLSGKTGALQSGITATAMGILIFMFTSWLIFQIPQVTPPMFRDRPRALIYRWIARLKGK